MCSYKIWSDVDELAFYENAIILEALARSQAEQLHPDRRNCSDLAWARDFLDDFALIAAGPGGASNVAAACLELSQDEEDSITIRVAKNEDFDFGAWQRLSLVVEVMNQVRQRDLSLSEGEERCFELIVQSCRPRIIKQITGPTGLWSLAHQFSMASVDVLPDFPLSNGAQHSESRADSETIGEYSSRTHEEFMHLAASRWRRMVELTDRVEISPDPEAIKCLARLAYGVRRSDSFRALLRALFRQPRHHASKIVERVGKIAKFFRSAVNLAQVAAGASLGSKHIEVETVPSVSRSIGILRARNVADMVRRAPALSGQPDSRAAEVQRLLQRWRKYIVHAEMLLLIFYEEHPEIVLATNYIGISKRSCYLCANFIRMHNVFTVEGQHQQLYCLWTLPEEVRFRSQTQSAHFSKALTDLQRLLQNKVATISLPSYRPLTYLKESVANLSRATITARAESLEKLAMFNEAEEYMDSHVSLPALMEDEAEERTIQDRGSAASASSPLADITVKCASYPEEAILEISQVPPLKIASTIETRPLEQRGGRCSQAGNRRRRPRARLDAIYGGVSRHTVSRAAIPRQPRRSAKRRKGRHVRSRNIQGRVTRSPMATRRHSRRASHTRHEQVGVGCSSLLMSFLKSFKKVIFMAFGGGYEPQTKLRRT